MGEAQTPYREHGVAVAIPNRDEIIAEICDRLGEGESLTAICELPGMPRHNTFFRWLHGDDAAWQRYTQAREIQAHAYAARAMDEALGATDAAIGKLRLDALKWAAGKLAPKFYGDSQQVRHADADGNKLDTAPLVGELLTMLGGNASADQAPINITPRLVNGNPQPALRAFDVGYKPRAKRALPPAVDDLV